ncbi:FAD-dependent monooxygenase [Paraburkholderia dipogonis]
MRDAGNIAWKLASVIKGQADPGILVSYEDRAVGIMRRP